MTITRTHADGTKTEIIIEHNTISCRTISGLYPIMRLSRNADYVIKLNKTTISTCSTPALIYALTSDTSVFDLVAFHIMRIDREYSTNKKLSRAAFYEHFFTDENAEKIVDFFNNSDSGTRRMIIHDHMCDNHTVKMAGMISFSTCVRLNPFCLARMKKNFAVCKYCFAHAQLNIYAAQLKKLIRAHYIATRCKWSIDDIPYIDYKKFPYFRLEAFGDIVNTLQVENYNTLARVNAQNGVMTTLWTKNPNIIQIAINNGLQLSRNLVIGLSSLQLNTPEIDKAKKYSFIRFLFTVYDENYISEHNIKINCGGLHCLSCLRCYEQAAKTNTLILINEKLK